MKNNLDTLLSFLRKGAVVGGAIGAMVGSVVFTGILALGGGNGSIWVFVVVGFFGGAASGAYYGACFGLFFWLLWAIWKLFCDELRKTGKR